MSRVVIDVTGKVWPRYFVGGHLVPAHDELVAAIRSHFGALFDDAAAAMRALADR